jgi:hypothetical protein
MERAVARQRTHTSAWLFGIVALAWSLFFSGGVFAQTPSTFSQDFRLWSPVFLTVKLPPIFLLTWKSNRALQIWTMPAISISCFSVPRLAIN